MGLQRREQIRKPLNFSTAGHVHRPRALQEAGAVRGVTNEQKVERAFKNFIENGSNKPGWLLGYRRATPKEEGRGIDFVFETTVGKIFLQVKSSITGRNIAEQKNPRIPVVVIKVDWSEEVVLHHCLEVLTKEVERYLAQRSHPQDWTLE